jgi:hypothetical protein
MNRKYALDVIRDAHESWQRIALGNDESEAVHYGVETRNITLQDSFGLTRTDDPSYTSIPPACPKPPAYVDPSSESFGSSVVCDPSTNHRMVVNKIFFISSAQV